jgi:hypothetical protein
MPGAGSVESGGIRLPTHRMIVIDAPARGRSIFRTRRRASLALRRRRRCRERSIVRELSRNGTRAINRTGDRAHHGRFDLPVPIGVETHPRGLRRTIVFSVGAADLSPPTSYVVTQHPAPLENTQVFLRPTVGLQGRWVWQLDRLARRDLDLELGLKARQLAGEGFAVGRGLVERGAERWRDVGRRLSNGRRIGFEDCDVERRIDRRAGAQKPRDDQHQQHEHQPEQQRSQPVRPAWVKGTGEAGCGHKDRGKIPSFPSPYARRSRTAGRMEVLRPRSSVDGSPGSVTRP